VRAASCNTAQRLEMHHYASPTHAVASVLLDTSHLEHHLRAVVQPWLLVTDPDAPRRHQRQGQLLQKRQQAAASAPLRGGVGRQDAFGGLDEGRGCVVGG